MVLMWAQIAPYCHAFGGGGEEGRRAEVRRMTDDTRPKAVDSKSHKKCEKVDNLRRYVLMREDSEE